MRRTEETAEKATRIFVAADHVLLQAGYDAPALHSHQALHLLIGLEGPVRLQTAAEDGRKHTESQGFLLDTGVPHCCGREPRNMLVLLADSTSDLAAGLREKLNGRSYCPIEHRAAEELAACYRDKLLKGKEDAGQYKDFYAFLLERLQLRKPYRQMDLRILEVIRGVQERESLEAGLLPALAGQVSLSESRLSHLFRESTGISLNSFLLLSRIQKTYRYLSEDESGGLTAACLRAGFSSSAHFAAQHRQLFGLPPRDIALRARFLFAQDCGI